MFNAEQEEGNTIATVYAVKDHRKAQSRLTITDVSIVIVHWNRPVECSRTVDCFAEKVVINEITVIDNGSEAACVQELKALLPSKINLMFLPENRGWGGAVNVAMKDWLQNSTNRYFCVSAHDALTQDGCLEKLVEAMERDPSLGIVCPEYGESNIPRYSPIRGARLLPVSPRMAGTVEKVDFAHGTLALFRRECLEKIGFFDERLFAYGDETEIGIRARKKGWGVAVVWGSMVINPGSWTPKPLVTYLWTRNSLLMAKTYGGWFAGGVRVGLVVGNTLRLVLTGQLGKGEVCMRMMAARDYIFGKNGPPTSEVWEGLGYR